VYTNQTDLSQLFGMSCKQGTVHVLSLLCRNYRNILINLILLGIYYVDDV